MKTQVNLKEVLVNAPKGLKLYSPAYGEIYFQCIKNLDYMMSPLAPMIVCKSKSGNEKTFFVNGTISTNGECILFPDNKQTWEEWQKVLMKVGDIVRLDKYNKVCKIIDRLGENQIRVRDTKDVICIYDLTDCSYASKKEIEEYLGTVPKIPEIKPTAKELHKDKEEEHTVVINLVGGPGCGKSTIAAGLFYELKKLGVSCELVCEYAKEKVWEESFNTMKDELYLFAKQLHKQWRLKGKVHFIITDHCLLNSVVYNKEASESFKNLVFEEFNKFININFFVIREKKYETAGRIETEEESKQLDKNFKELFDKNNISYEEVRYNTAVSDILVHLSYKHAESLNPYKLDLGDIIVLEDSSKSWKIISIIRCIKNNDLYDVVRLTINGEDKKLEMNPINALDELDKCQFSYRAALDDEVELLYDEMNDQGWAWDSARKIIEVFDI